VGGKDEEGTAGDEDVAGELGLKVPFGFMLIRS